VRIRILNNEIDANSLNPEITAMIDDVASFFELLEEDRPTDKLLRQTIEYIQTQRWSLYQ
uniref:hypothetical protein n=1 Tax=Enterococcus faecium TaxID=1352 RepID=UPI0034E961C4